MSIQYRPMVGPDDICDYYPTRLRSLPVRLFRALRLAYRTWTPRWSKRYDPSDPFDCISPRLAWTVAWGVHHDSREITKK